MTDTLYYLFPYDEYAIYAKRRNPDGTESLRCVLGTTDQIYGPQKTRFDMRQERPYIITHDYAECRKVLDRIRNYRIAEDISSCGYNYDRFHRMVSHNRTFLQAGYDEKHLYILTSGKDDDCRVAIIQREESRETPPWSKLPVIRPVGGWRWHRFDEMRELNEDAVRLISRQEAVSMALELFKIHRDGWIREFSEWCGVIV